jgi:hypothetical protein
MEALPQMTPLRLRRLEVGWAQWELARASRVSIHKLSFAERGLVGVLNSIDRRRLAAVLDADVHALFPHTGSDASARPARRAIAFSNETGTVPTGLPNARCSEDDDPG